MIARPFKKARAVNSTSSAFPSLVAEIDLQYVDAGTAAGRSIIPISSGRGGGYVPKRMEIWPYAVGAKSDAFSMRAIGWRRVLPVGSGEPRTLFVPGVIINAVCTVGSFTGLAGFPVLDTELFVDTITMTNPNEPTKLGNSTLRDGFTKTFTFANDTPARVQIMVEGFEAVELQWDQTTNTPTMNALYTFIDDEC